MNSKLLLFIVIAIALSSLVPADEVTQEIVYPSEQAACESFTYSSCPSYCQKKCVPSACSSDGICTADCDGAGSCFATQRLCAVCENGKDTGKKDEYGCPIYDCPSTTCSGNIPACNENQNAVIVSKDSNTGCPIYQCKENECKTYVDERNCKIFTCQDGTYKEYCPEQTCQSYVDIEGCTITKCKDTSSRSCPAKPECKSFVNEKGCTVTVCSDGKESVTCQESGSYARLGEEFKLLPGQSAKITDYNYLKVTLHEIMQPACIDSLNGQCFNARAFLYVESQTLCKMEPCTQEMQKLVLEQGKSEEAFGAKISLLDSSSERAVLVVNAEQRDGGVAVEIFPTEQSMVYGEKARYKISVTDKHHPIVCITAPCDQPVYEYFINVRNLPFQKEYPKHIQVAAGQSSSFELIVFPFQVAESSASTEGIVVATGRTVQENRPVAIAKPVKGDGKVPETANEHIESNAFTKFYRSYKFNVQVMEKNEPHNQDVAYAALLIKPEIPPEPVPVPPEFPGEGLTVKLHKGWNLLGLPGKILKFEKEGLPSKMVAFVFLKDEQRYVSMQEAQKILGDAFSEYLAKNAFWIFTREETIMKVRIDRSIAYSDLEVRKGWNLLPITEDMVGGYFTDIKGDCVTEKMFIWSSESQSWTKVNEDFVFSGNDGFLYRAADDCHFGGAIIGVTPPAMPE